MRNSQTFTVTVLLVIPILLNTYKLFANDKDTLGPSIFEQSIEDLIGQEVTIATKSAQKLSQTPSAVSVVTAEEIKAMGYRDLEELLQSIPGFEAGQSRSGAMQIGVRGVTNIRQGGRILILLDGLPYNDVMYGSSVFFGATFNLDAVERVEIIRGPGSALYGRNAFSCVINLITKKAKGKNNVELGASYGSYDTYDARASYGYKSNKFSGNINTKYYSTKGTNSTYRNGEGGENVWNLTHDNFYLNANAQYKDFEFYGSFTSRDDGNSPTPSTVGDFISNGGTSFQIATYNLNYTKSLSSNFNISAKLYGRNEFRFQDIELTTPRTTDLIQIQDSVWVPLNAIYQKGAYAEPVFDAYTYGAELEFSIKPIKNNQLLIGLQADLHGVINAKVRSNYDLATSLPLYYIENGQAVFYGKEDMPIYEPGWIKNNGHRYQNAAIYFQDVHYFLDNLSVTLGGRLDYDSEVGLIFNPRLGMVFEPTQTTSIKLLYGKAYRAPTVNEQYKIVGLDNGNENLVHEDIHTGEIVFSYAGKNLYSQLSFFYNYLDNLILQLNINDTSNVKSYFNKGKNTSYGFEYEAKYFFSKRIHGFANYSYNLSEDIYSINGGENKVNHPNVSKHKVNVGLNTRLLNNLNWSVLMRYKGKIQKYLNDAGTSDNPYLSQDPLGNFVILNSTISYTGLLKGLSISLQGYNLLNTKYYYQDNQFAHQPSQPGRHFLIRLEYKFN